MYESFYGLSSKPFQVVPNPAYLYKSPKHEAALTYIEYGLSENVGFILLTGEVGSGKTTLVQYLLGRLDAGIEPAVIFNTNFSAEELIGMILEELDVPRPAGDKAAMLSALNHRLIEIYGRRKRVVLIIDEAQNLSEQALEEIRMLSNLQSEEQSLLQIMLVGQPELLVKLQQPSLRQFTQRIAASYHLTGLDRVETAKYIAHRVQKAGGRAELFTPAAVDLIYEASGGIPRTINLACQAALVYGFAGGAERIGQDIIRQIKEDHLGIGIVGDERSAALPAPPGPAHRPANDGLEKRVADLERGFGDLRQILAERIREVEGRTQKSAQHLVANFEKLLKEERARNDLLMSESMRIKTENLQLRQIGRRLNERLKMLLDRTP